jgi:competence protein ComEA
VDPLPPSWSVIDPPPGEPPPVAAPGTAAARYVPFAAIAIAAFGAIAVIVALASGTPRGPAPSVALPSERSASASHEPADEIVVEVTGAVRKPGLIRLPASSRVADAVAAAGGFGPAVDTTAASALHLAKPVADGDQVHVPVRGEHPSTPPAAGSGPGTPGSPDVPGAATGPIDLNAATEAELDSLPGVGPATVAKIVAGRTERPFASVDELRDRKIVGPATLAKIRDLVVVH